MAHPREGWSPNGRSTRRVLFERAGGAAVGFSSLGAFLAACANSTSPAGTTPASTTAAAGGGTTSTAPTVPLGPRGIPLARPDHPVTMPLYPTNPAIASGLAPETGATLNVYNWTSYLNQKVINAFQKKYNCKVSLTQFATMEEAMTKVTNKTIPFDVFFPTIDHVTTLVAGEFLKPLNLSYIPNLKANIWQQLQTPWYDRGSNYTVPYTFWTTGIAWRNDKLPRLNLDALPNPYDVFWQSRRIAGKVVLLDDQRDAIGMVLLRNGISNLSIEDPAVLQKVQTQLKQLVKLDNVKFDTTDWTDIPTGLSWLSQAWSGDIISATQYLPKGVPPTVMSYWWPKDGRGDTNNDIIAINKDTKVPVLAHLFLNHILDYKQSLLNMQFVGYQQPQTGQLPSALVSEGLVAPNLTRCIATEAQYNNAYHVGPLSTAGQGLYQNTWAAVKGGGA